MFTILLSIKKKFVANKKTTPKEWSGVFVADALAAVVMQTICR